MQNSHCTHLINLQNIVSKKRKIQLTAVAFLILAVLLLIPNTEWSVNTSVYGFVSLVIGTIGSIISIFIPTSHTYNFNKFDWGKSSNSDEFSLYIKADKHGVGNSPQTQVFLRDNNDYQEVVIYSSHDNKGNIIISACETFDGKVVIT